MKNIIAKQLIDSLVTATINGANGVFIDLFSYSRLEQGMKTVVKPIYAHVDDDGTKKRKEYAAWLESRGYIRTLIGTQTWFVMPNSDGIPKAVVSLGERHDAVVGEVYGDPDEADALIEKVRTYITKKEGMFINIARMSSGMFSNGVTFDQEFVPNEDLELASQSFYPWLNISLEDYFKAYMESKQSVLILIGPAGTGKSTFIRTLFKYLLDRYEESGVLAYDPDVVGEVSLVNRFFSSDSSVLAYEDMDAQIAKRTDGNQFMQTLLNQTSGVVRRKQKKLVFSTNLPNTKSIDEALMRKGRCFDILEFGLLNPDQASAIAKERNMEFTDFSSKEKWSLAEVLVHEDTTLQTANRFRNKIGFTS